MCCVGSVVSLGQGAPGGETGDERVLRQAVGCEVASDLQGVQGLHNKQVPGEPEAGADVQRGAADADRGRELAESGVRFSGALGADQPAGVRGSGSGRGAVAVGERDGLVSERDERGSDAGGGRCEDTRDSYFRIIR